jgi:choline kinase
VLTIHQTEWCYNYHDPLNPHSITISLYPKPDEQRRFIRSYVLHHPRFPTGQGSQTPSQEPSKHSASSSSISAFYLDSRSPGTNLLNPKDTNHDDAEAEIEKEVERLMAETRLWRLACSAQWVAWGVVQAKIPGMPEFEKTPRNSVAEGAAHGDVETVGTDPLSPEARAMQEDLKDKRPDRLEKPEEVEEDEDEDEFDYLGYAHERALFFWGDAVRLGIVGLQELPEGLRERIRKVDY